MPVLALALAASCGGRAEPQSAATEADVPTAGGTLRLMQTAPDSLDPLHCDSIYNSLPVRQIFDPLVDIDPMLNLVPGLAEDWTVFDGGRTYEFHLRRGVRFHDGTPLTAADVAFTLRRTLAPESGGRSLAFPYLDVVQGARDFSAGRRPDLPGIEVVDDHTLRVRLRRPYPSFLTVLSMDALSIVPEAAVRQAGDAAFSRAPIGTGPFRLAEWTGEGLRLTANPDYFDGPPHLEDVTVRFARTAQETPIETRFLSGEIDLFEPGPSLPAELTTETGSARFVVQRYQELSLNFVGFNTARPPFDRLWLRQAIAHVLDPRRMVAEAPERRRIATGILPPGLLGYSPDVKTLAYDPQRAARLLADHGHPGGRDLPGIPLYHAPTSAQTDRAVPRIVADLRALGLAVDAHEVDWDTLSAIIEGDEPGMFVLSWLADMNDPDSFLRSLFESAGSGNYFKYSDPVTDDLLERGSTERHPARRVHIYRDLERHVLEQAPIVPLFHSRGVLVLRDRVAGLKPGPFGLAGVDLETVWLREEGRS